MGWKEGDEGGRTKRRRKIKEALFIDCLNPQNQISDSIMNLEKGLEISACWKEFNPTVFPRI